MDGIIAVIVFTVLFSWAAGRFASRLCGCEECRQRRGLTRCH
jgi:hypothetical protein